ncbi:hypothetical protein EVAR_49854_1 [Eumeta japonica]|uniref:Uncharacterized protein n=1 Tax=Eumeta variegata TaxID=151549 RepID=A0A4C1XVA2_EUMVA|nr:hypothetical protein EVAR_49854_1 [Eumeta japonica]
MNQIYQMKFGYGFRIHSMGSHKTNSLISMERSWLGVQGAASDLKVSRSILTTTELTDELPCLEEHTKLSVADVVVSSVTKASNSHRANGEGLKFKSLHLK